MPLGERSNNQNNQFKDPTTLSSISFANSLSELDKSSLSFSYWKGFLKIDIAPLKEVDSKGVASYDRENSIAVYLKHTKAYILLKEIEKKKKDPNKYTNVGVNSGSGLISISNGKEFGYENTPCLVIRKVNAEGETETSIAYAFRTNFHFAVRDYDEKDHQFKSIYDGYENTELEMFKTLLKNYINAGTSAYAAEVISKNAFAQYRMNNDLGAIAQKLGVDFGSRNKGKSSNSYFSNNTNNSKASASFESGTVEDIYGAMMD